jgi:hypothetical protein
VPLRPQGRGRSGALASIARWGAAACASDWDRELVFPVTMLCATVRGKTGGPLPPPRGVSTPRISHDRHHLGARGVKHVDLQNHHVPRGTTP